MKTATYVIEQRGDQWCLLTSDGSRVIGCHDSREGAEAQERAVQAAKNSDSYSVPGVEIFKAGTWNGDEYGVEDIDAMVAASAEVGFTPALKAGHSFDDSQPALGWVENLRRKGDSLFADLVALPKSVYDAIVGRRYDAVSAEIYWDVKRNGKKFSRVLKGLALLGAEPPAVDLTPLRDFFALSALPEARFAYYSVALATEASMEIKTHAGTVDPDADGNCPEGYTKGEDGKCHMSDMSLKGDTVTTQTVSSDIPVKENQIVVDLGELRVLKEKAARADVLAGMEQQLEREKVAAAELAAKQRQDRINYKIRDLKIPAFRPFMRVFYDVALTHAPAERIYSLTDPKITMSAEDVVDRFIDAVNKQADVLFREMSINTPKVDPAEPDDTQGRVSYRVNAYLRANKLDPAKDYKAALTAVLNSDPELKEAYRL